MGLPDYQGTGQVSIDPTMMPSADATAVSGEPHLSELGSALPVSDGLISPPAPASAPAIAAPAIASAPVTEVRLATEEIRSAKINQTPENLALMAANTTRPAMAPRGVNRSIVDHAYQSAPEQMATNTASSPAPPSPDLAEILELARRLETSHR